MITIYILQDDCGSAIGASFELEEISKIIQHAKSREVYWTYREVPFYKCEGTEINIIAGPIPQEYLNNSSTINSENEKKGK